jgi:hypothetical protein
MSETHMKAISVPNVLRSKPSTDKWTFGDKSAMLHARATKMIKLKISMQYLPIRLLNW